MKPVKKIKAFLNKGNERSILTKKNIFASFAIKICTIFTTMALYPLTLNYLNEERNGVWITLTNMILWVALFDLGFGNGLRNKYAEAKANGNLDLAQKYVSSTYAFLCLLWFSVFIIFAIVNPLLDWAKMFPKVSPEYLGELYQVSWIVVFAFGFQFIFKLLGSILSADQRPAITSFIDMLGQLLTLVGVFILTRTTVPSLPKLGLIAGFAPVLVYIVASIILFNTRYKETRPSFRQINFAFGKDLMNLGVKFFIATVASLMIASTLTFLMQFVVNPEEVSRYGASYRLFTMALNVLGIIVVPYWSSFTDAYTVKDYQWMNNSVKILRKIFLGFLIFQLIVLALSPVLYYLWINVWLKESPLDITWGLSIVVCLYVCVQGWLNLHIYPINGIGKMKIQVYSSLFEMVLFIPLAIFLGKQFGTIGIVLAPILIYIPRMIWAPIQLNKLVNGTAKGIWCQ